MEHTVVKKVNSVYKSLHYITFTKQNRQLLLLDKATFILIPVEFYPY